MPNGKRRGCAADADAGLVERIGLPVLNPLEALLPLSRQKNAERLQGIAGLKVPRLAHYDLAGCGIDAVASGIGATVWASLSG